MQGIKKKKVCEGCKYRMGIGSGRYLSKTCNYMEMTGKSRLVVEMNNGGYKTDSCICYEKRKNKVPHSQDKI